MGDAIITVDELKTLIDSKPSNLRIIDVSMGNEEGYKSAHIPGAVYMDIFHEVKHTDYLVRNLPTSDVFQAYVRSLGVSDDSDVIVYDGGDNGGGYMSAGRAWFLFKYHGHGHVRILDGGLEKWKEAKYSTSSDIPAPEAGDFKVSLKKNLLKTFDEMVDNLDSKMHQVLDTRPPAAFAEGHIAGATNIPFGGNLIDPGKKCLRTREELKSAFEGANIDLSKPTVASCMGGMTSCTALVAAAQLGTKDMPLYVGSWAEWRKRATGSQIEKC